MRERSGELPPAGAEVVIGLPVELDKRNVLIATSNAVRNGVGGEHLRKDIPRVLDAQDPDNVEQLITMAEEGKLGVKEGEDYSEIGPGQVISFTRALEDESRRSGRVPALFLIPASAEDPRIGLNMLSQRSGVKVA